jgi:hypothetical protein
MYLDDLEAWPTSSDILLLKVIYIFIFVVI